MRDIIVTLTNDISAELNEIEQFLLQNNFILQQKTEKKTRKISTVLE
jgi:hypothetical protein